MENMNPSWDPVEYATTAPFNVTEAGRVLTLLQARAGERILDLGCGEGTLTQRLQGFGCQVVGVDASPEQVAAARAKGIDAQVADAHALGFEQAFDAVFSNAALHWLKRPAEAVQSVARALRPGGRFVAECGGHGCVAAIRAALYAVIRQRGLDPTALDPWYFPEEAVYVALLADNGFVVQHSELVARPTLLPTGLSGWLRTFAKPFLSALPESESETVVEEVAQIVRPILGTAAGGELADYVRLRFVARLA